LDDNETYRRETTMTNLEYVELYPRVDVYRNVLKDPQALYQTMKKSEETSNGEYFLKTWDPWAKFGTYTQKKHIDEVSEDVKSKDMFIQEKDFADQVQEAYDLVLLDYIKRHDVELNPGWHFSGCSFSKYNDQIDILENKMTMQYHTDFIIAERDMPGSKFQLTCTMYINDDYEGGDIEFFVDGKLINHKPKAGDILVFPSDEPYFHGVKTIYNGQKFFVRNFVMHPYEGSPEWLENQKKFGAVNWMKKEFIRLEEDTKKNMKYVMDGVEIAAEVAHAKNNQQVGGM
jgi:hypothetical protein